MTEHLHSEPSASGEAARRHGTSAPKEAAPGLSVRAPRPSAVRLRRSVVQTIVIGGALLVSGSLAWAFVVQPELRENARDRAAEARVDDVRGLVRPAEAVTDQPATYDRLPEPRAGGQTVDAEPAADAPTRPAAPSVYRPAPPITPPVSRRAHPF